MSFDPTLFSDYRKAKAAAAVLAKVMHMTIGQDSRGKPALYRDGHPPQPFPTWLALYTHLNRLRTDQVRSKTA